MRREKRFAAADWLSECLRNNGLEGGAGWALALVDGVLERVHSLTQAEVEALTAAVQSSIENDGDPEDFFGADTRDMAETAVNTVFAFLGLRGEIPA
jgi:hypothetical protein